jgi:hypothetical protein
MGKIVAIVAFTSWLALGVGHANATPADLAAVDNHFDSLRIAGVNIEGHHESLLKAGSPPVMICAPASVSRVRSSRSPRVPSSLSTQHAELNDDHPPPLSLGVDKA